MPEQAQDIDACGLAVVEALIANVRAAGLEDAAEMFRTTYWAWLRLTQCYVCAHPYVERPEPGGMTPISALTVTDGCFRHWAPLIPGTPLLDDERVRREAYADEAWHHEEDRRMRREAGEDI